MDSSPVCAQEKLVVSSANSCEYDSLLCHGADELAILVQDQNFATFP